MTAKPTKVMISVLTTYERTGWICKELAEFLVTAPYMSREYMIACGFVHNFIPAASGRNHVGKKFEESQFDWLCMIDNDMAPPANLLDTIKDAPEDAEIISPVFHLWNNVTGKLVNCWGIENEPQRNQYGRGSVDRGFVPLSKTGTGVIFIKRGALSKMPYPWFQYLYNEEGGLEGTEDIFMCELAKKAGVKIYGNTEIEVGHYKSVDLNVAMNAQHRLILDIEKAEVVD